MGPGYRLSRFALGRHDNGGELGSNKPGIRAQYHAAYYGAFVLDADGRNVEAVCHGPE